MADISNEYQWKDFEIVLAGRPLVRFMDFKYKTDQESKEIYGRGDEPLGIQRGNKKYSGEIKIGQSEFEALNLSAKAIGSNIEDLDYTLSMAYAKNGVVVTDIAEGVVFEGYEKGMKQGDEAMEITLKFKCRKIVFNGR